MTQFQIIYGTLIRLTDGARLTNEFHLPVTITPFNMLSGKNSDLGFELTGLNNYNWLSDDYLNIKEAGKDGQFYNDDASVLNDQIFTRFLSISPLSRTII